MMLTGQIDFYIYFKCEVVHLFSLIIFSVFFFSHTLELFVSVSDPQQ